MGMERVSLTLLLREDICLQTYILDKFLLIDENYFPNSGIQAPEEKVLPISEELFKI
jgi:hypothetical protein